MNELTNEKRHSPIRQFTNSPISKEMQLTLLKAKLHRIRVTEACLDYEGSLSLDPDDMEAVGILPFEKILCADVENGNRFETYAIEGKRGSHVCCLNGAAAHKG